MQGAEAAIKTSESAFAEGVCFPLEVRAQRGDLETVDQLSDEWRELCGQSADDQPFFRPEFIRAHIRCVIPGSTVVIITVRHRGRLRLVLPLVEELGSFSRVPVRRLRAPVNCNCGRFDGVRAKGSDGDEAVRATWQYLKDLRGWDLLQFRTVPEASTVDLLAEAARADGYLTVKLSDNPNPYVAVPSNAELLNRMPHNMKLRSQLRQIRRRLAAQGLLTFYRVTTADRDALEKFYRLEASGWKGRQRSAIVHNGTRPFFDELAVSAARFGYFCLYMLEFNGELIAAHYSLVYRNRCYSPIVAYNENFKQFAPGHLIVGEILKDCSARGIAGYDITGQNQPWKMKWASQTLAVNHHYIFRGPIGRLAYIFGSRLRSSVGRVSTSEMRLTSES